MNVYEATEERLSIIFRDFENVLVAFSCGKDSGVMLNMAYEYAKKNNLLHKLNYYYEDYEAGYIYTHEYAERTFKTIEANRKFWLCLPISAACSVSMYENRWIPWNPEQKDIWVRDMPNSEYVINISNCPFYFQVGMKGFDTRIYFAEWFAKKYGKTAVLIGIRAQESLTRRAIFTSKHRRHMHNNLKWSKVVDKNTVNFYPIFDWLTEDIWVCNYKKEFDYNKIYDLYYQAGLTIDQMRVASPFHLSGQETLKLYRVIDPHNWGKMVGRVNGCNFGGIYGGTSAMAWRKISKPKNFTWKQYAEFLISTLPENTKKKLIYHLDRFRESWSSKGYGRNPKVIKAIKEHGVEIENTKNISKLCKKKDVYEIIKIKGDWPDEINIDNSTPFRHCPNWKAVCITIMKNDFSLQYMSVSRTKDKLMLRNSGLKKYENLKKIGK